MLPSERDSAIGKVADKSEQTPAVPVSTDAFRQQPHRFGCVEAAAAYSSEDAGTADGKRSRRQRDVQKMEFAGR